MQITHFVKTEKLLVKSVLFAVVFLLYWCHYLQLQSLGVSEFVFFFSYQWFEVLVQIIDSILLSSLEYGRQGGFMGVTLKCPLFLRMKKWHLLLYPVQLALCCIKCSPSGQGHLLLKLILILCAQLGLKILLHIFVAWIFQMY